MSKKNIYQQIYKIWLLKKAGEGEDLKSTARAAGVTSSALTQSLKSLEDFTQKSLLIREKSGVRLSTEGEELVSTFTPILSAIGDYAENHYDKEVSLRKLVLGAYDSLAISLIPELCTRLRLLFPDLKVELTTDRSNSLAGSIRKGILDGALVVDRDESDFYYSDTIYKNRLGLFIHESMTGLDDPIKNLGLGTLAPGQDGHAYYLMKMIRDIKVSNNQIKYVTDSFESLRALTEKKQVVGLMPYDVAQRANERLVEITDRYLEKNNSVHSINLITRKNFDPRLRALLVQNLKETALSEQRSIMAPESEKEQCLTQY
jgi:DNA-binding transcriptional LysR family regulator